MSCRFCQTNNEPDAAFCKKCGSKISTPEAEPATTATFFEPTSTTAAKPSLAAPVRVLIAVGALVFALIVGAVIANSANTNTIADDYSVDESIVEEPIVPIDWAPEGFTQYDDYLAYEFVTNEGDWPCEDCNFWKLKVTSHYGCPGGVYAELNMLDSSGTVVEWSNDTVPSLDAGQNAILVFENYPYDDNLDSGQISDLTCHG